MNAAVRLSCVNGRNLIRVSLNSPGFRSSNARGTTAARSRKDRLILPEFLRYLQSIPPAWSDSFFSITSVSS